MTTTTTENPNGTDTRTVVVVGHGMVGHRFVEALRSRDTQSTWKVVVLSEEAEAAYDRVGLSSYVGAWDRGALALTGNTYAGDARVDLRLGTDAAGELYLLVAEIDLPADADVSAVEAGIRAAAGELGVGATLRPAEADEL